MSDDKRPVADIDLCFLSGIRDAVKAMQGAGLNWAQIGCIVQDIRSHALNEEFRRIKQLVEDHPPHHHGWGQIGRAIKDDAD